MANEIEIKLLSENATVPTRAYATDSGLDLYSAEKVSVDALGKALVSTDIAINIPEGYEAQVRPRSGVTSKTRLRVQLGTIDQSYHGNIKIIVDNVAYHSDEYINVGDKIAQLVIAPVETPVPKVVKEFESVGERGSNGFGSTGGYSSVDSITEDIPEQEETMIITRREYLALMDEVAWLACLEAAGIDNTSAYGHAQDMYDEMYGEEEDE